jgi:6-phosphogluconolactonase
MQIRRWHIYPDLYDLEAHTTDAILRSAWQATKTRGRFNVVLAGGNTPRRLYARLAKAIADWSQWHVYFGDERCLPPGDPGRNDAMAHQAWLNYVGIPRRQIYAIPAELGPAVAAARYAETVASIELFDLVLLGVGEDGHVASLFPGLWTGVDGADVLPVHGSPKPPAERVSLSGARLARARQVFFLVTGRAKRDAVAAWRAGALIPAAAIMPSAGVDILLDAGAWPDERL